MAKIKTIIIGIVGALGAFLMLVIQSKNRKIEKQKTELSAKTEKIKEKEFVINEDNKTIVNRNDASFKSDDDIKRLYEQNKWFRD